MTSSNSDDEQENKEKGLTFEDVEKMSETEINDRWPEVSKVLEAQQQHPPQR